MLLRRRVYATLAFWTVIGVLASGCEAPAFALAADTTPPSAPTGLAASDLTCSSVTLTWSAATDETGVAFYDLYHDGQAIGSTTVDVRKVTLGVVPGARWGFYVNARDAAGNVSQASKTVSVSVPFCSDDTTAPSVPSGLTGTAIGTAVTLRWTAATDDVAVTGYEVLRDGEKVGALAGTAASPPDTTFTDVGLDAATDYTYSVVARDAQENRSEASAEVRVHTGNSCAAVCGIKQVTTERDLPWGLVQLPDGTVLYGQRDLFTIQAMQPDGSDKHSIGEVPDADGTDGEGGVLGLAVSPTFATDHWLYVYHTTAEDNRIVRFQYADGTLDTESQEILVTGIPRNKYHNGGRLRFGPDGKLYAAAGDGQDPDQAQDLDNLGGKVLRLNPDGSVPADNPFPGSYVWSYGHRNPQGLAFDSKGRLWEQEFGNNVMDETNLIVKGGNYGWPACEGTIGDACGNSGYIAPVQTYPVASASCSGIAIVRDVLYLACLRGTRLYRAVINGNRLADVQQYYVGTYGRLRTVEPSIDGNLWLTTSTGGDKDSRPNNSNEKIFKLTLGDG
jgi:glucose/arabinose dehydrogenase